MSVFDKEKLNKLKEKEKKSKKHTIMIVDDKEGHLSSMESLLSDDYDIITAQDAKKALEIIKNMEHPEKISLIISDQRMPEITGVKLFKRLISIIPHTIRIIITGYIDVPVIINSINEANIYQFILKPFEPDDLKLRLRRGIEAYEQKMLLIEASFSDFLS